MVDSTGNDLDDISRLVVEGSAGDYVYREDDTDSEMYIIQEGEIELLKDYLEGDTRQVAVLEPGDFFGEMSLLEDLPREFSARGVTDYKLLKIDHSTFDRIIQESPDVAVRMLRKLSRRVRDHQEAELRAAEIARQVLVKTPEPQEAKFRSALSGRLLHEASGTEFELAKDEETTIGRPDRETGFVPTVDLSTLDTRKTVSRRHAKVIPREDGFHLREEMGVANGTFVNDRRVKTAQPVPIRDGDRVRFGLVETVLKCS